MRRISRLTWTGLALLAAAFLVVGFPAVWEATRINIPVAMPVSLRVGDVRTPEFRVDNNQLYIIEIRAKKRIPFETECCLMGIAGTMFKCSEQSIIQADWTIWSDHKAVANGSSRDEDGGSFSEEFLGRYLGSFKGDSAKKYILDVRFTKDGTQLAAADPYLNVEVHSDTYEDYAVITLFSFAIALCLAIGGCSVLVFAGVRRLRRRRPV